MLVLPESSIELRGHTSHSSNPIDTDMGQTLATCFSGVIKPVCCLIESMVQIETFLGIDPVQPVVIVLLDIHD